MDMTLSIDSTSSFLHLSLETVITLIHGPVGGNKCQMNAVLVSIITDI